MLFSTRCFAHMQHPVYTQETIPRKDCWKGPSIYRITQVILKCSYCTMTAPRDSVWTIKATVSRSN